MDDLLILKNDLLNFDLSNDNLLSYFTSLTFSDKLKIFLYSKFVTNNIYSKSTSEQLSFFISEIDSLLLLQNSFSSTVNSFLKIFT